MVRELTPDEVPLTFPIGHAFSREAGVPFAEEPFLACWQNIFAVGMGVIFGIDSPDGSRLDGSIGAVLAPAMFDGAMVATECWWFVHPECRDRAIGPTLMSHFEAWARSKGAKRLTMVNLHAGRLAEVAAIYQKLGFTPLETHWQKELA